MATATSISLTSIVTITDYQSINATNFGATPTSAPTVHYEDYDVINPVEYSLAEYTKFQGYFPTTQQYERWTLRNQSSSTSPTGKALDGISIIHSWIDK